MEKIGIQMIGTQRSGSNLLRVMLNQLNISAPHPPHVIERLMPFISMYGNLQSEYNFKRLIRDVCLLIKTNPVSWGEMDLSPEKIMLYCKRNELVEVMRVIYEQKCQLDGNKIWMCKSMANIYYIDELEKSLKPLYLYLYRDGRDVALSFKKAVVGEKHIYYLAKQWQKEQEIVFALKNNIESNRIITIRYENLINYPNNELERICQFLNISFDTSALEYYNSQESKNTAYSGKMWENVAKPIIPTNFNKYKTGLSETEIKIFEKVAGTTLLKLGYPLEYPEVLNEEPFSVDEISIFNAENNKAKLEILEHQTEQDRKNRENQNKVLKSIKEQYRHFLNQNIDKINGANQPI